MGAMQPAMCSKQWKGVSHGAAESFYGRNQGRKEYVGNLCL